MPGEHYDAQKATKTQTLCSLMDLLLYLQQAQPAAANAGEQPAEGAAQPRSRFQRYFKLEDSPSESPAPPAAATLQGARDIVIRA